MDHKLFGGKQREVKKKKKRKNNDVAKIKSDDKIAAQKIMLWYN
jgi:hypothetical protein